MKKIIGMIVAGAMVLSICLPGVYAQGNKKEVEKEKTKQVKQIQSKAKEKEKEAKEKENNKYKTKFEDLKKQLEKQYKNTKGKQDLIKKLAQLKKQYNDHNIVIFVDGKEIKLDVQPEVKGTKWDKMIIPAKQLAQALGAKVTYAGKTVTIVKENTPKGKVEIVFTIGSKTATVNGSVLKLDEYIKSKGNQVMIPLGFIAKILNCRYTVDPSGIVIIDKGQNDVKPSPEVTRYVSVNDNNNTTTTSAGLNVIVYSNDWKSGAQPGAFQGDNHWSDVKDGVAYISFTGSSIAIYGAKAPIHGMAFITIDPGTDKEKTFMVDYYAATRVDNTLIFQSPKLTEGTHLLSLKVLQQKNDASTGYTITVDRVEIGSKATPTPSPAPSASPSPSPSPTVSPAPTV